VAGYAAALAGKLARAPAVLVDAGHKLLALAASLHRNGVRHGVRLAREARRTFACRCMSQVTATAWMLIVARCYAIHDRLSIVVGGAWRRSRAGAALARRGGAGGARSARAGQQRHA